MGGCGAAVRPGTSNITDSAAYDTQEAGQVRRAAVSPNQLRQDLRHVRRAAAAAFAAGDVQGYPRRGCAGATWLRNHQVLLKEDG